METQVPPPIPVRKVKYDLDRRDVLGCRLWVAAHNRFLLWFMIIMVVFWPALLNFSNPSWATTSLGMKIFLLVFEALLAVCFVAAIQVVTHVVFLLSRKNQGVVGHHELEIREEGLAQRTNVNESLHRWQGFHKVASTPAFIFVYTTENNVEYIPRRAFASEQESKQFEQELITRFKRAQNKTF